MQPRCYFAFTFLCSLSFLSSVLSLQCNETQYAWPLTQAQFCCNKCTPGTILIERCSASDQTRCDPCKGKRYSDNYNVKKTCNICDNCDRPNMEYKSNCTATHNAVCRCKVGYECKDQPCKQCLPILSSTTTLPRLSTVLKPGVVTTVWTPPKPLRDTVWFLVIIALLSAGLVFLALTKIKPFLRWMTSNYDNLFPKAHEPVLPCSEDEEVSKPVQEAGNVTNPKTDPELGLIKNSQTVI